MNNFDTNGFSKSVLRTTHDYKTWRLYWSQWTSEDWWAFMHECHSVAMSHLLGFKLEKIENMAILQTTLYTIWLYTAIPYRARTGVSLCSISTQEKPVFNTGIPGDENRFFLVRNITQEKPCFHYRNGFAVFPNKVSISVLYQPELILPKAKLTSEMLWQNLWK